MPNTFWISRDKPDKHSKVHLWSAKPRKYRKYGHEVYWIGRHVVVLNNDDAEYLPSVEPGECKECKVVEA